MVESQSQLSGTGIRFAYDAANPVLTNVSLRVEPGEMVALFGPNGAGKSTLLRILGGLLTANAGQVHVGERALTDLSPLQRARAVARIPQGLDAWPDVRVADLVESGRYCHTQTMGWKRLVAGGESDPDGRAAIAAAVQATGCDRWWERSVRDLSGGERERVLMARALAQNAPILLADEPTRSLDPQHQLEAFRILREQTKQGRSVLVVTHDWNLASQFADRLVCLAGGTVHAEGTPSEVLVPEVLEAVFGKDLFFGELPGGVRPGTPIVLPWRG